jgi:AraC family transcriptional regulator of arabinose operon
MFQEKTEHPNYQNLEPGIIIADLFNESDSYVTKRPQGMEDWLITYTLSGQGYFTVGKKTIYCNANQVVLIRPGTPHHYGTSPGETWKFVWAHFSTQLLETNLLPLEELIIQSIDTTSKRIRIYRAFKKVISDSRERSDLWHELCKNALIEILLLLAVNRSKKTDPRIQETLNLLSERMQEPIKIEKLAKMVGISSSRLSHLFKENTGLSIIETVNQMRLDQAALLLQHTNRTALEISLDVGFMNYNHFASLFHTRYGVNPSKLRSRP